MANIDVTVLSARCGDFADTSLDASSIASVLDCHVWSNNSVHMAARNVSASTVDLAAAPLAGQVTKRRIPPAAGAEPSPPQPPSITRPGLCRPA